MTSLLHGLAGAVPPVRARAGPQLRDAASRVLMMLARVIMVASTWPSRSYLLVVAANLALRGS